MGVRVTTTTADHTRRGEPITVALIHYYDVVVAGVARMFDGYPDRIAVADIPDTAVDIALYDAFARPSTDHDDFRALIASPTATKVAVHTWNFDLRPIDDALDNGAAGYLSKALPARELVDALERIHDGEVVVSDPPRPGRLTVGADWPGRVEGLSEREAEVLALIVQGHSNLSIAGQLFLSANTVKTYIRSAYRKIGARRRVGAVLWGMEHGFAPDRSRIDEWSVRPTGRPTSDEHGTG